jgi:hypothetical protein
MLGAKGPKVCRLSVHQRNEISERLKMLNGRMLSDFARQPRSLTEQDRWKATEYPQFLLYTGAIVLRDIVPEDIYHVFLSLSVAFSIMLNSDDETRNAYLPFAKNVIDHFVDNCSSIYGPTFASYNIHSLKHLHEDVSQHNCSLNNISAFPFENYLQKIKKLVKGTHNPIAQVCKRLKEVEHVDIKKTQKLKSKFFLSTKPKDRCFLLESEDYAIIREVRTDGKLDCNIIKQHRASNFFINPCQSKLINVISVRHLENGTRNLLQRNDLKRKAVCLSYRNEFVPFPLLHEIEQFR